MYSFKKSEVTENQYNKLKNIQLDNNSIIKEQRIGSRKKLYSKSFMIATYSNNKNLPIGKLTTSKFYSFIGIFNKNLYNQFYLNESLYELDIKYKGVARAKNTEFWDSMHIGTYFYNIDLSSAYWQLAFKLGYISENLFQKYIDNDTYKEAKRYCITFLARTNQMTYINNESNFEIVCDTNLLKKVYQNIRFELYNCIQQSLVGIDDWIEYNIDGVNIMSYDLNKVRTIFRNNGLKYKITECRKISETEYSHGSKIKRFKNNFINRSI
jgi:hypothetical protein